MRLWLDPHGSIVDDGRLLSYISAHGSLSAALQDGDFRLLSDVDGTQADGRSGSGARPSSIRDRRRRLTDYLEPSEG